MPGFYEYGLSFQYPTSLNSNYASIANPPEVTISVHQRQLIDMNGCYLGLTGSGKPSADSKIILNNVKFCQSDDLSLGADALSGHYYFTTYYKTGYVTLGYKIGAPNGCGSLSGKPDYQSCENFENNYNSIVIQPLQQSAGTLIFK